MKDPQPEKNPSAMELHRPMEVAQSEQVPSVGMMLKAVIEKGLTGENVKAVESLVGLYERMEAKQAEKDFAAAFAELQKEMPKVVASKAIPDKNGKTKYFYAPYEAIMDQVGPLLLKHGFSVSFDTRYEGARIYQVCNLQHVGGHKRSSQFGCTIGGGPPGANQAQADGAASTYAKRFALCNALNITIGGLDTDARLDEVDNVTPKQAETLRMMIRETGSDEAGFLKFAKADSYGEIRANRYEELHAILQKRMKTT